MIVFVIVIVIMFVIGFRVSSQIRKFVSINLEIK